MSVVLRIPGVLGALLSSLVAQIPMGALGLLLVLHTQDVTGTYAAGGLVTAAYGLALGISNPVLARIADRYGQVPVLVLGAPVAASAIVAQALLADGAPVWLRAVLAAVAGAAQPPVGAFRRRIWNVLVPDPALRHRAYATEGVLAETVYLLGPLAIVAGIGSWSVVAALGLCAAAIVVGNLAFAQHPAVRGLTVSTAEERAGHGLVGALRAPGVGVALVVFLALGTTVGAIEVAVPAALDEMGHRSWTGVALAVWGVGSVLGGLVMARTSAPRRPTRRLAVLVAAWGALHGLLALAGTPVLLTLGLLAAGATIAPALTVFNGMLDRIALPGTLTEAVTWTSTGMLVGIAVGGAAAGHLAESASPAVALTIGATGILGAVVLALGRRTMVGHPQAAVAAGPR